MQSILTAYCDCCGLPVRGQSEENCSRCGYPLNADKERHFLESAVSDLERVARYGGAQLTVQMLIQRYQRRLAMLHQPVGARFIAPRFIAPSSSITQPLPLQEQQVEKPAGPVSASQPAGQHTPLPVESTQAFSLRSFFADQTINIVASLGAFLILVGSLSFVATTTNLLLSFLAMFLVHAIFGTVGVVTYRFRNFRTVAAIYTAIFALLVPLVGFSGYRLIAGHVITLSAPTLIAIVAAYAALAYSALAIYQRFQPFGYLAAISLIVVDLAVAFTYSLNFWWWPATLMILAFGSLVTAPRQKEQLRLFEGSVAILFRPVRFLMTTCIVIGTIAVAVLPMGSLAADGLRHSLYELRTATFVLSLCILVWFALFIWLGKYKDGATGVAYLFVYSVLLFGYMLDFHQTRYALAITAVAVLYHAVNRVSPRFLQPYALLREHLDGIALLLVVIVPFITTSFIPWTPLWAVAYSSAAVVPFTTPRAATLTMLLIGCALTISIMLRHTGLRRMVDKNSVAWTWFLLLSGFLFAWAWGIGTLTLGIVPVWSFLVLTLVFVTCTLFVRRFIGAAWANPLDVLALSTSFLTLTYCFSQSVETSSILFFFFAALSYGIVLYQHRRAWLFVSLIFLLGVLLVFTLRPRALFIASLLLPFIAVIVHRSYTERFATAVNTTKQISVRFVTWEWPLLMSGLLYSLLFFSMEYASPASVIQQWLGYPFPVVLELAFTALTWYGAAVLARVKWWLVMVSVFGSLAVLLPTNTLTELSWIAPTLALCAFSVSRWSDRDWAIPLYISSLLAGLMIGVHGYASQQNTTAALALLGFAGVIYLIGVVENRNLFLIVGSGFAIWALTFITQPAEGYRLVSIALFCTAAGALTLLIHHMKPAWFMRNHRSRRVAYVLPFYSVVVAAAILVGLYSSVFAPFAFSVLCTFIALTLCILLIERVPELLVLPIGLTLITIAHMPWLFWQQMLACSVLFVLAFATRFTWQVLPAATKLFSPQHLHELLGLGGQTVVVCLIAVNGGLPLFTMLDEILAHTGVGTLLLLSGLVFWYGLVQGGQSTRRWSLYASGFLLSLVVSWEQIAFHQTHIDVLSLVPATYLIVVSPFLSRDQKIASHHAIGQFCSIVGAALLLLPSLWFSFSQDNLQPTVILAGESLALFIVGVSTRIRFFILSGAALVMVSAMHALFLPSLGIPPFLAMAILGITLLLLATALKLMSARIKVLWNEAE